MALDACLGACSVAVLDGDAVRSQLREPMERGHAERLPELLREALQRAQAGVETLDLIATTCGPGGFTGARLGVSLARGLALARGIPAIGVTTLEALAFGHPGRVLCALRGRRGDVFLQRFVDGRAISGPASVADGEARRAVDAFGPESIVGNVETLAGRALPWIESEGADIRAVAGAALAAWRRGDAMMPPLPVYLRAADARPSAPALPHVDG